MAKKNNMPGAVKGLGKFSKLDSFDASVMKAPRQAPPSKTPAAKAKVVDVSAPRIVGGTAFRPLGAPKVKKYYGG